MSSPGAQTSKNNLVHELFVRTADENYVTARWCAINGLNIDFLWLAVHALEKYLKAVLLMNGRTSEGYSHDIVRLYEAIKMFAAPLLPNRLVKPADLNIFHWREQTPEEFVAYLLSNGSADNRYLIYGYVTHSENLHKLDQVVFAVRRLICALDERFISGNRPGTPTITNREVLTNQPRYLNRMFMPLDKLIAGEDSPARDAALNMNLEFAPSDFKHSAIPGGSASVNPVIIRRILDPLESDDRNWAAEGVEVATWFLANVQVPGRPGSPGVRQQIEQVMAEARRKHALP